MSLFEPLAADSTALPNAPLPERMRPRSLAEFAGQQHLLGPGKPLRLAIKAGEPGSMIFWGPPGTGKTTLAKIVAGSLSANFVVFSGNQRLERDQAGDGRCGARRRTRHAHCAVCG